MGERSRRDELAEAFDSYEEEQEEQEEGGSEEDTEEPVGDTETSEGEGDESEDGDSDDSDDGDETEDEAEVEPAKAKGKPADIKRGPSEKIPGSEQSVKPPVSWKPSAKEMWSKLPPEVQQEVYRREREIEQFHNQTANDRKLASQFNETIRPFEPLIASQNSTPLQAVRNLMTTAAGLTLGTQVQKAQILGNIIQQYGVDINTLDEVLSGQVSPENNQNHQLNMMLEQRLAPIQNFIQEIQGMRQTYEQRQTQDTESQIQQFAQSHDFFEDVRMDMADIMELAAKRGQPMDMEEAYKRAVALNPEISSILEKRQKIQSAAQQGNTIRRKRAAASSVRGAPAGSSGGGGGGDSIRGAIEAAWDEANG